MSRTNTRAILFRILMGAYLALVAYLCFANFHHLPSISRTIFGIPTDKVVHFIMFFPFPFLAFFCYDKDAHTLWKLLGRLLCVFSYGCIFAGCTEVVQGMLTYRSQDIRDFRSDCLALGISTALALVVGLRKMKRK